MLSISSPSPRKLVPTTTGQIQIIFGPMFSGKTTELIRRCKRYKIANYNCVVVKYARDNRYSVDELSTHDKISLPALPAVQLSNVFDQLLSFDVVGIDEGQFFPDVVKIAEDLANAGKTVIVAALDGTYQRKAFPNFLNLVPLAESIVKLTSVCCSCHGDAAFTKRKGTETALEVIGGCESYSALCRRCYLLEKTPDKRNSEELNGDKSESQRKLFANEVIKESATKALFKKDENACF